MKFDKMEILSLQLYNYGNIIRITHESLGILSKATSIFKFLFQNDTENSFKSEFYYLDFNADDPDGTKISH